MFTINGILFLFVCLTISIKSTFSSNDKDSPSPATASPNIPLQPLFIVCSTSLASELWSKLPFFEKGVFKLGIMPFI